MAFALTANERGLPSDPSRIICPYCDKTVVVDVGDPLNPLSNFDAIMLEGGVTMHYSCYRLWEEKQIRAKEERARRTVFAMREAIDNHLVSYYTLYNRFNVGSYKYCSYCKGLLTDREPGMTYGETVTRGAPTPLYYYPTNEEENTTAGPWYLSTEGLTKQEATDRMRVMVQERGGRLDCDGKGECFAVDSRGGRTRIIITELHAGNARPYYSAKEEGFNSTIVPSVRALTDPFEKNYVHNDCWRTLSQMSIYWDKEEGEEGHTHDVKV